MQAGSPSREEGQAGADALEQQQAERQDTGRTQFWTPAASPMPSASEEVQAQVAAAAPPADADGDWSVQAVRGDTGGRPLQAVADGLPVGAEGCGSSSLDVSRPGSAAASYSADRSESVESSSEVRAACWVPALSTLVSCRLPSAPQLRRAACWPPWGAGPGGLVQSGPLAGILPPAWAHAPEACPHAAAEAGFDVCCG